MSSQTTTAPADRPNLQERGRRAEQQEINLHENPQSRNPQGAMKHGTVGNPTFHRRVENRENASGKRRYHQNRPRKPQPGERKTNSRRRVEQSKTKQTLIAINTNRRASSFANQNSRRWQKLPTAPAMLATDARLAIRTPRTAAFAMQYTQVMFHGNQHDMRIFQTEVALRLAFIERALPLGVCFQRVIAIRMLVARNRPSSNDGSSATCR